MSKEFKGFTPPVSNYFRMPNEWIDICAEITNLAELKVVQYVLRHTWGYHEYDGKPKPITIDEFMHGRKRKDGTRIDKGTGLSEMSVRNGLEKAIENGYITCESDERDRARIKKSYKLNMLKSGVQDLDPKTKKTGVQDLGDEVQSLDLKVQDLDLGTQKVRPRSEKETKEKHFKKNTIERKNDAAQQKPTQSRRQKSSSLSPSATSQKSFSFDEVSPEAKKIFTLHDELEGYTVPRTERDIKDALELARCSVTIEDLRAVKEFILEDNAEWYEKHGIDFHALVVYYPKWKSAQMMKAIMADRPASSPPQSSTRGKAGVAMSSYDDDDYVDDTFYPVREVTRATH